MALTQVPIELSSTPGIVDNSNAMAITIDSSENVLVGMTSASTTVDGLYLRPGTNSGINASGSHTLTLNRRTNDGDILKFDKDGTTVGSIQSRAGVVSTIILDPRTNGAGLTGSTNGLIPVNQAGSTADNHVDLGSSSSRFKDLYLSGGAYLGGTGAANKLDDYEEGTFTVTFANTAGDMTATNLSFNASGNYVKVGELVFVRGDVSTQGTLGGSGGAAVLLTGFPFASPSSTYIKIYVDDSASYNRPSVAPTSIEIVGATTQARVKTSTNVYQTNMPQSELGQSGNANRFYFNGVYRTTA